jgi:hypothetical protein
LVYNINTVIDKAIEASASIIFIRDLDVSNGVGPGFQVHKDISVPLTAVIFDRLDLVEQGSSCTSGRALVFMLFNQPFNLSF